MESKTLYIFKSHCKYIFFVLFFSVVILCCTKSNQVIKQTGLLEQESTAVWDQGSGLDQKSSLEFKALLKTYW